jgi:hypothetical protein
MDRKCMDISFLDMGLSKQLHWAYRFESEKLLNPTNQVEPFYIVQTDSSKIMAFLGAISKNYSMLADLILDLIYILK